MDVLTKVRYIGEVTDESVLVTSVLHDVVEECDTTIKKVKRKFGLRVAKLVSELTREEPDPNKLVGLSETDIWKLRSDMLCDGISKMSPEAQIVKLADRLSNLEEARKTRSGDKLTRYIEQTKRILQIIPRKTSPALYDAVKSLVDV